MNPFWHTATFWLATIVKRQHYNIGTSFYYELKILGSRTILLPGGSGLVPFSSGWFWVVLTNLEGLRGLRSVPYDPETFPMTTPISIGNGPFECLGGTKPHIRVSSKIEIENFPKPKNQDRKIWKPWTFFLYFQIYTCILFVRYLWKLWELGNVSKMFLPVTMFFRPLRGPLPVWRHPQAVRPATRVGGKSHPKFLKTFKKNETQFSK